MIGAAHSVGGIVLCGGRSTRMGRPKEWLPFGDETLLQRIVRVEGAVARPVVVAARRGQELPPLPPEVCIVHDAIEDFGPLAGIAAGLAALDGRCEAALVVTCDHPFLRSAVLERLVALLEGHPAVVVQHAGQVYPLLGVYRLDTRPVLQRLLAAAEHRAQRYPEACGARLLDAESLRDIDAQLACLTNINDPLSYDESRLAHRAETSHEPQ
jgi:molybdopterin-guanine dinucleotide biosynthesis protein A